jgi:chromosome segregation ATPase
LKPLLFRLLTLNNFKLHRSTQIDLGESPITLITGANGSGKTQILEAIILCLGGSHSSSRIGTNEEMIGNFGETAELSLEIANPQINGKRLLSFQNEVFNRLLITDMIKIGVSVRPNQAIKYSINDKFSIDGERISRRDIREMLKLLNINADNELAFTGAHTVEVFSGESARAKFERLLELTNLDEVRSELLDAMKLYSDSSERIRPIKAVLKAHEEALGLIQERWKMLQQREELLKEQERLELEKGWALVSIREEELRLLQGEINSREEKKEKNGLRIDTLDAKIRDFKKKEQLLNLKISTLDDNLKDKTKEMNFLRDKTSRLEGELKTYTRQELKIQSDLDGLKKQLEVVGKGNKETREREIAEELDKLSLREDDIIQRRRKIKLEISEFETRTYTRTSSKGSRFEQSGERGCKLFKKELVKRELDKEIIGPIYQIINLKKGEEKWKEAINRFIGTELFTFIALSRAALNDGVKLYKELFPKRDTPISLTRIDDYDYEKFLNDQSAKSRIQKVEILSRSTPLYNSASELLEGHNRVLAYLRVRVRGVVAEEGKDANQFVDIARDVRVPILTANGSFYVNQFGSFTRPPAPYTLELGKEGKEQLIEDNMPTQKELENEDDILRRESSTFGKKRFELNQELNRYSVDMAQIHFLISDKKEEYLKIVEQVKKLQEELTEKRRGYEEKKKAVEELDLEQKLAQTTLKTLEEQLITNNQEFNFLFRTNEDLEREIEFLREKIDPQEQLVNEVLEIAEKLGEKPEEVLDYEEVNNQLQKVKGEIRAIIGNPITRQTVEEKEHEVKKLKEEVDEGIEHIINCKKDVEKRLKEWAEELYSLIFALQKRVNLFMEVSNIRKLRIYLDKVDKPGETQLHLDGLTSNKDWLDFRRLSSGEKVVSVNAIINAFHSLTYSPIHAIDEIDQRLDHGNSIAVFKMIQKSFEIAKDQNDEIVPQFVIICPDTIGVAENDLITHWVLALSNPKKKIEDLEEQEN